MNKIVFIVGESGSGKSYLQENLIREYPDTYTRIISTTSRDRREGEIDGLHYHFRNKSKFEELINQDSLLQHVEFGGNYYGTQMSEYRQSQDIGLFICTTEGVNDTIKGLSDKGITLEYQIIFLLTSDSKIKSHGVDIERMRRGDIRGDFVKALANGDFVGVDITVLTDKDLTDNSHIKVNNTINRSTETI